MSSLSKYPTRFASDILCCFPPSISGHSHQTSYSCLFPFSHKQDGLLNIYTPSLGGYQWVNYFLYVLCKLTSYSIMKAVMLSVLVLSLVSTVSMSRSLYRLLHEKHKTKFLFHQAFLSCSTPASAFFLGCLYIRGETILFLDNDVMLLSTFADSH